MTEHGPMAIPRLCVYAEHHTVKYVWQVLFKHMDEGEYSVEKIEPYLEQLRPSSGYTFCLGIREYPPEIRFHTKNLRQWGIPFHRIDATACEMWHIPHNIHHPQEISSVILVSHAGFFTMTYASWQRKRVLCQTNRRLP